MKRTFRKRVAFVLRTLADQITGEKTVAFAQAVQYEEKYIVKESKMFKGTRFNKPIAGIEDDELKDQLKEAIALGIIEKIEEGKLIQFTEFKNTKELEARVLFIIPKDTYKTII